MRSFAFLFFCGLFAFTGVGSLLALQCCLTHAPSATPSPSIQQPGAAERLALEEGPQMPNVQTSQSGVQLSGHIDAGYLYNFTPAGSRVRQRFFETDGIPKGDFNFHAFTLNLFKALPSANDWAAGFELELTIGEDAAHLHHHPEEEHHEEEEFLGSDTFHIHQAYILFRVPIGNGLDGKIGKFHGPLGLECCPVRPHQLHITRSHLARVEPEHLIGIALEYPLAPDWRLGGSVSNPQDVDEGLGIDINSDEYAITGYVEYSSQQAFRVRGGFYWAPWGDSSFEMEENEQAFMLNLSGQWRPQIGSGKWLIAWDSAYAHFQDFAPDDSSNFYGVALYTRYQFTDLFSLGGRIDYVHTDDDNILRLGDGQITDHHAGSIDARSNDIVGITTTAQFDLAQDLILRIEYRADLGNDIVNTTPQEHDSTFESRDIAHTLAVEVTYRF